MLDFWFASIHTIRKCHSERSEESLISLWIRGNGQRCFASLNMTVLFQYEFSVI